MERRGGASGDPRERRPESGFPRRDEAGRVLGVVDLLALVLAGMLIGLAVVAAIDGVMALLGLGTFGQASGWLAGILPLWLFTEEFRAWHGTPARWAVALVGAAGGVLLGLLAAGATGYLPPLGSGAVGAVVAAGGYAVVWFHGVRWLSARVGQ